MGLIRAMERYAMEETSPGIRRDEGKADRAAARRGVSPSAANQGQDRRLRAIDADHDAAFLQLRERRNLWPGTSSGAFRRTFTASAYTRPWSVPHRAGRDRMWSGRRPDGGRAMRLGNTSAQPGQQHQPHPCKIRPLLTRLVDESLV